MTPTQRKAMEMALEILEHGVCNFWAAHDDDADETITALRAALAEPDHIPDAGKMVEPFGYFKAEPFGWTDCAPDDEGAIALYEAPQHAQVVDLTDEQASDLGDKIVRAIKAAHGITGETK